MFNLVFRAKKTLYLKLSRTTPRSRNDTLSADILIVKNNSYNATQSFNNSVSLS